MKINRQEATVVWLTRESTDCQPGKKHVVAFYALLGHFVLGSAQET